MTKLCSELHSTDVCIDYTEFQKSSRSDVISVCTCYLLRQPMLSISLHLQTYCCALMCLFHFAASCKAPRLQSGVLSPRTAAALPEPSVSVAQRLAEKDTDAFLTSCKKTKKQKTTTCADRLSLTHLCIHAFRRACVSARACQCGARV